MNLTQDYTLKKIQKEKPLKQLQISYEELHKQHTKAQEKLMNATKDLKELKSKNELLQRELMKKQRTVENLLDEKTAIHSKLNENLEKKRKLENKIVVGGSKNEIVNQQVIKSLKTEKLELEAELDQAYQKIDDLEDHVKVISRALELKLEGTSERDQISFLQAAENLEKIDQWKEKDKLWKIKLEELKAENEELVSEKETLTKQNDYLSSLNKELEVKLKSFEGLNKDLRIVRKS
jgi:chromosome segregation ATPase